MRVQNDVFWRQTFPSPNNDTILCGLQHTAWRSELLLQSCVSKNSDAHREWKRGSMHFSAEILAVKSEVGNLLQQTAWAKGPCSALVCAAVKKTSSLTLPRSPQRHLQGKPRSSQADTWTKTQWLKIIWLGRCTKRNWKGLQRSEAISGNLIH